MDLCWVSCYDWMKVSLLVPVCSEGESFSLRAVCEWGRAHSLTFEEAESWKNVCTERLWRACHAATGEGVGEDVTLA